MTKAKGQCLCGAVKFTAENINNNVGACHCGMCRRWGGGPLMVVSCGTEITFEGEVTVYDSSDWAERGFCTKCGSHLFYRIKATKQHEVPAGLFENQEDFNFNLQVYIDNKPSFYSFANKTNEMTEADVIKMYAPKQDT